MLQALLEKRFDAGLRGQRKDLESVRMPLEHIQCVAANAAGGAVNILNGVDSTQISGARFCIGYGENSGSMLTAQSLVEVLSLEGASSSASGVPCVLFMENYDINRTGYHDMRDTMENIDLDYGAAVCAMTIEAVARMAALDG